MKTKRLYQFDNIRFFLMFFVILGHFLEITNGYGSDCLPYRIIYSFHMPAFIFLSGYFAKYKPQKIMLCFVYPYIIFQFLYQLFDFYILNSDIEKQLKFQFTTPYWLLWYLLVMILYYLFIPFIDTDKKSIRYVLLGGSVITSLLAGYDTSIGYYLSLSRFFTFFPFFLAGYYIGHDCDFINKIKTYTCKCWFKILNIISIFVACFYLWKNKEISSFVLYGTYSYSVAKYGILTKFMLLLIAFLWIIFLFFVLPYMNRKIPFISRIGSNTLPIFLLHGFFVKLIYKYGVLASDSSGNLLLVFIFTFSIMILLGNSIIASVFHIFFTGDLIMKISKYKSKHTK